MSDSQGGPPGGFEQPQQPPYSGQPQYPAQQPYIQPPGYGYPQQPPYGPPPGYGYPGPYGVPQPNNGIGVAGFVCGLLGLIFFWIPFVGLVLGILGVILGAAGISGGRRSGAGTGLAIAGLVCGVVSLVPAIIVIAALSNA